MTDTDVRDRIDHGVLYGGRGADGRRLADALGSQRVQGGGVTVWAVSNVEGRPRWASRTPSGWP